MALVLYHVEDAAKEKQLSALCRELHLTARRLTNADRDRAVAALCGEKVNANVQKAPAGYKLPEVMIFSGFAGEMLDVFLAAYKKAGIAPIPLKAVRTEHNDKWSLYALCEELRREHAAMLLLCSSLSALESKVIDNLKMERPRGFETRGRFLLGYCLKKMPLFRLLQLHLVFNLFQQGAGADAHGKAEFIKGFQCGFALAALNGAEVGASYPRQPTDELLRHSFFLTNSLNDLPYNNCV